MAAGGGTGTWWARLDSTIFITHGDRDVVGFLGPHINSRGDRDVVGFLGPHINRRGDRDLVGGGLGREPVAAEHGGRLRRQPPAARQGGCRDCAEGGRDRDTQGTWIGHDGSGLTETRRKRS